LILHSTKQRFKALPPPPLPEQRQRRFSEIFNLVVSFQDIILTISSNISLLRYASSPSVGGLRNPDLIDCILVDHAQVLTLFSHFFQAAEAGAVNIMELLTGAIVLELRLHSAAEMQALYPILAQRLGGEGMALTQRALAEHAMLEKSLEEILRLRRPGDKEPLITRVKQLEIETMTHLAEEESMILPRMAAACTPQELANLGLSFRTAKQTAPLMPQTGAAIAAMEAMSPSNASNQR
jgi:Hemerythrin HHE cation binding domain